MIISIFFSAVIIAKAIRPEFIGENIVLCMVTFCICAILQLFYIAMAMNCPDKKTNKFNTYTKTGL